jgi:hypothetical protein
MERLLSRLKIEELSRKKGEEEGDFSSNEQVAAFSTSHKKGNNNNKAHQNHNNNKRESDNPKRKGNCNHCGKPGHWVRECRKLKAENNNNGGGRNNNNNNGGGGKNHHNKKRNDEGAGDCQAFMGLMEPPPPPSFPALDPKNVWISDSGASRHFTGRKDWIMDYTPYREPVMVNLSNNSHVKALGSGTVWLDAFVQDNWIPVKLKDVVYIPGGVNLFSEMIMDQKGFKIVRENNVVTYYKDNKKGPQGFATNGSYKMLFRYPDPNLLNTTVNTAKVWHERLGHINSGYIKQAIKNEAVTGLSLHEIQGEFHCQECHLGKETRLPFPAKRKTGSNGTR